MPSLQTMTPTNETQLTEAAESPKQTASSAVDTLAARQSILAKMEKPLQDAAIKFVHMEGQGSASMLLVTWDQGELVRQILRDEATYGDHAIKLMADYLGMSESRLYALRTLADNFTRAEMKALGHREMRNGEHITRGHLLELVPVRSKRDRTKIIQAIFNESLSVRDLAASIAEKFVPGPKAHRNGRKPKTPSSPAAGIEEMTRVANSVNNRVEVWVKAVFDELDEAEPDRFNETMIAKMKESLKSVETMEVGVATIKTRLQKNLDRARRVMDLRDQKKDRETLASAVSTRSPRRISRQPGMKA